MKYEQPNLALLGNASEVVQGVETKRIANFDNVDPLNELQSDGAAYSADE